MQTKDILLPLPKSLMEKEGYFVARWDIAILLEELNAECMPAAATMVQKAFLKYTSLDNVAVRATTGEIAQGQIFFCRGLPGKKGSYQLDVTENGITAIYSDGEGAMNAAATLAQLVQAFGIKLPCIIIKDEPTFETRSYLLDISRGRVPKLDHLKELVEWLSAMKINQLQLYVEKSMRLPVNDEITSQSDTLEPLDIISLDTFCAERGIELVPCIATFGHLYDLLRSKKYRHLSEMPEGTGEPFSWYNRMRYHILDVSNPESFMLVKTILDSYLPLFRSKKVNICCDETFDLGKGKSADLLEKEGYAALYCAFINKVAGYLHKKGYEVMVWADIVLRHPEALELLDKKITCLNWHYYYDADPKKVSILAQHGFKQLVCPSVSGFSRFVNAYDMAFTNMREMAQLGVQYNASGYLNTDWGDSSHVNMPWPTLPCIAFGAAMGWNSADARLSEEIDSVLEHTCFGQENSGIMTLLRELSRQDIVIMNHIWFFRDYKALGLEYHVFDMCLYENAKQTIMQADGSALLKAASRAMEISVELGGTSTLSIAARRELTLSARAVALMQALTLSIKKHEYGQDVEELFLPEQLAEMMVSWLRDYCNAWQQISHESELWSIKQIITDLCYTLRSYSGTSKFKHLQ